MTQPLDTKLSKPRFIAPKLEVYGRARDITRNINGTGRGDGGTPASSNKTLP